MPWTVADVDRHKRGLTPQQKRQWVRIANGALSRCLSGGGNQSSCEASAIRQANGVAGNAEEMYNLCRRMRITEFVLRHIKDGHIWWSPW